MIKTNSLTVSRGEKALLKDIEIEIGEGETVVLCGKSGSGKTLLCKALKGILPDQFSVSGSVKIEGDVGFLFQDPRQQLVRRKVRDDIAFELENRNFPPEQIRNLIEKYSKIFGLKGILDKKVGNLSSGQVARVALAGSLLGDPEIVILDEPSAYLDAGGKKTMMEQIKRLQKAGKTLIIAEQDLRSLFSIANRLILLEDGTVSSSGSPENLIPSLDASGIRLPIRAELKAKSGSDANQSK